MWRVLLIIKLDRQESNDVAEKQWNFLHGSPTAHQKHLRRDCEFFGIWLSWAQLSRKYTFRRARVYNGPYDRGYFETYFNETCDNLTPFVHKCHILDSTFNKSINNFQVLFWKLIIEYSSTEWMNKFRIELNGPYIGLFRAASNKFSLAWLRCVSSSFRQAFTKNRLRLL